MNNIFVAYGFVIACVLALGAGQIIFKAISLRINSITELLSDWNSLALFIGALSLYGVSTILWIIALRSVPLSRAYPFMAIGFVIVPIAAHYIFGEKINVNQFLGLALIVTGLFISAT